MKLIFQSVTLNVLSICVYGSTGVKYDFVPDTISYPYDVHVISCELPSPLDSNITTVNASSYSCRYFCSSSLLSPYLVRLGSGCVTQDPSILSDFSAPNVFVPTVKVLSPSTTVDESLKYKLTGGARVFIADCIGTPCTAGSNLVVFGEVLETNVYGIGSQSHACTTCAAKVPIPIISLAGKPGGFVLYNGLSWTSADRATPPTTDYTRQQGLIANLLSFDNVVPDGYTGTVESVGGFETNRSPKIFTAYMDEACRRLSNSGTTGLTASVYAEAQYLGKPQCADPTTGQGVAGNCFRDRFLPFTGTNNNQFLTITKSGTIAICACAVLSPSVGCLHPMYRFFAGLVTVAGPLGTQQWSVPIGTEFGLSVKGWGLGVKGAGRDFIRFVFPGTKCTDASNEPVSITNFKIGCPNCTAVAGLGTNIVGLAARSADNSTIPKIKRIKLYEGFARLDFVSSVSGIVFSGDRIAILLSTILVDGKARNAWTAIDAFRAFQFAGRGRYADTWNTTCASSDCDDLITGHVVTVETGGMSATIPAGLDEFEAISITPIAPGADWERHSQLDISEHLKATSALEGVPVCWGRLSSDLSTVLYYSQAGTISFYKPAVMAASSLSFMTRMPDVEQTIVLTFVPNFRNNALYLSSTVVLKITLLDLSKLDLVIARSSINAEIGCGDIFNELATNHVDGFPQPANCSLSGAISDMGTLAREIKLFFSPDSSEKLRAICTLASGTRSTCTYQLSFNGRLGASVIATDQLVKIDVIAPSLADPYYSFETSTTPSGINIQPAATMEATFSIANPDSSSLNLSVNVLSGTNAYIVRLFLAPSLQWNVSTSAGCSASDSRQTSVLCALETFSGNLNVVKLTLSEPLTSGFVEFTILFSGGNWLIPTGFVPVFHYMQLRASEATAIAFSKSINKLGFAANSAAGSASLVSAGPTGDGVKPFIHQTGDQVVVKFRILKTLTGPESAARLILPAGYWCLPPGSGWTFGSAANECLYRLSAGELWVGGAWQSVTVAVANPAVPIARTEINNKWALAVEFSGNETDRISPFSGSPRAVIAPVTYAAIQPSSLTTISSVQDVSVYISTSRELAEQSGIVIVPPSGFTFDRSPCVQLLTHLFYLSREAWRPFPFRAGDLECDSTSYLPSQTSLVVRSNRIIDAGSLIGFQVRVSGSETKAGDWALFLIDPSGEPLAGSLTAVEYGGRFGDVIPRMGSWRLYSATAGDSITISPSNLIPGPSAISIPGIRSVVDVTLGSLSIQIPDGFILQADQISLSSLPFPCAAVSNQGENRILFSNVTMAAGTSYSLSNLPVVVPEKEAEWSSYSAFIEIGPDVGGSVIPFPRIRAVTDLMVDYSSRVALTVNTVTLRFRTVTAVNAGQNITVGLDASFARNPLTLLHSFSGGVNALRLVKWTGNDVVFTVQSSTLPPGNYELKLIISNPNSPGQVFVWRVSTSTDAQAAERGPPITRSLKSARIITGSSGRDDRLGRSNNLVFEFSVPVNVSGRSVVTISGPPGFLFADDCALDVFVGTLSVLSCRGSTFDISNIRSWARITVEGFLNAEMATNLTVTVRNPIARGEESLNYWQLIVNDEFSSSPAIPSFELRDFAYFSVSMASTAISTIVSRPVTFSFSPKQSLPVTNTGKLRYRTDIRGTVFGELNVTINSGLRITMPPGFSWDANSRQWNELRDTESRASFSAPKNELYINRTSGQELFLVFNGNKTLIAGRNYTFITNVFINASADSGSKEFKITSLRPPEFVTMDESSYIAVSETFVNPVGNLTVSNLDSNYRPGAVVRTSIEIAGINSTGTIVDVEAPAGFNGSMTLPVVNSRASANFSVLNPERMSTNVTETYWRVNVRSSPGGPIVQSSSILSWRVVSLISSAQLVLTTGARRGAGTTSSVRLTIVPASDATFIHLNVTGPSGFNFAKASVDSSSGATIVQALSTTCFQCIGVGNLDLRRGQPYTLQIDSVQLGLVGADVTFSVRTFFIHPDETISNPLSMQSAFRDQISGVKGFFMSGALTIGKSEILPPAIAEKPDFVTDYLNPRTNLESLAVLSAVRFTLSPAALSTATGRLDQPLDTRIVIKAPTNRYRFPSSVATLFSVSPSIGTVVLATVHEATGTLTVDLQSFASQLRLLASSAFTISVPVIPVTGSVTAAWGIDMFVNGTLLNTNDGLSIVPSESTSIPVDSISAGAVRLSLISLLAAPNTFVDCRLDISGSLLPTGSNRIKLIAPSRFKFVAVSGAEVQFDKNVLIVTVGSATNISVNVKVLTPMLPSQAEANWAAISYASSGMTGWTRIENLPISPMPLVYILYGGTSGVSKASTVIDFTVRANESVASLEIYPPAGVAISCISRTVVKFINCTAPSTVRAGLTLNLTRGYLTIGRYTMPVLIDLSIATPKINQFDVVARDRLGVNVDGIYAFEGNEIVDSTYLSVINPSVTLSSQRAGSPATLNLTFHLTMSTKSVDAINIEFPAGYYHRITDPVNQVRSVSRKFPRKSATQWLYTNSTNSVTFLVDDTKANIFDPVTGRIVDLNNIPGGETYTFTFPIVVAPETPVIDNFWILSFCKSRYLLEECTRSTNSTAWSRFPILGAPVE